MIYFLCISLFGPYFHWGRRKRRVSLLIFGLGRIVGMRVLLAMDIPLFFLLLRRETLIPFAIFSCARSMIKGQGVFRRKERLGRHRCLIRFEVFFRFLYLFCFWTSFWFSLLLNKTKQTKIKRRKEMGGGRSWRPDLRQRQLFFVFLKLKMIFK